MGLWGPDCHPSDRRCDPAALPHMPWIQPGLQPLCGQERALVPRMVPWNQGGMRPLGGWRNRKRGGRADRWTDACTDGQCGNVCFPRAADRGCAPTPNHADRSVSCRPQPCGPLLPATPPPSSRAISAACSQDTLPRPHLSPTSAPFTHRDTGRPRGGRPRLTTACIPAPTWTQVTCTPGKAGLDPHRNVS